jgi:hypothetical protein
MYKAPARILHQYQCSFPFSDSELRILTNFRKSERYSFCSLYVVNKYLHLVTLLNFCARIAQSLQCLTTDWMTGVRCPTYAKDFSSSLCVQTSTEAHPASYPMDTGGPFPRVKRGRVVTLTTQPHLVPRSRMCRSCVFSPLGACMAVEGQLDNVKYLLHSVFPADGHFLLNTKEK